MQQTDIDDKAEKLMEVALEGGSTPSIRNKVYDRVIDSFKGMSPLEAVLVSMKLSEYIAPYDPYKYRELSERMLEHLKNPNIIPGEEEPMREHEGPPGPGPEAVEKIAEMREKQKEAAAAAAASQAGVTTSPKPVPKITPKKNSKVTTSKRTQEK